jgi:two-component system OmpR family response regulator
MRILIAEDDAALALGLLDSLRSGGHSVDAVGDGRAADAALRASPFDLLILDLGLPQMDGFEVLRRLRAGTRATMVLILSAENDIEARIRGLDLGADDYLTKPFDLGELEARVRALARRASGGQQVAGRCESLWLDQAGQRIWMQGRPLELTRAEYMVLATLIERCGKVVAKTQLFERLYDWEHEAHLNAIEVFISRVRKKIEPAGMHVRAIRGLGYLLEPVSRHSGDAGGHER